MMCNKKILKRRGLDHRQNWHLIAWGKMMNYIQSFYFGRWGMKRMDMTRNLNLVE